MKKMKTLLAGLAVAMIATVGATQIAHAAGGPTNKPREQEWSFAGPFGHWDLGQLQRGFKVYREACSACHSLNLVSFRNLADLGFSDDEIKAIASEYEVTDGPNADGEMFERPAVPADKFVGPWANAQEAAASNNGAAPPDFSLLAKARAPERGFPTFVFDIFTMYAENGPDYIYSLLTGYQDPPEGKEAPSDVVHYNPYFVAGDWIAMSAPLSDELVEYDDGTEATVSQMAKDVSAFMMWAAEPTLVERKSLGFKVMLFLAIFSILLYLTKKSVFANLKSEGRGGQASGGNTQSLAFAGAGATASAGATAARKAEPTGGGSKAKTPTASTKRAGIDYVDDIELIDGIGPTIAKRLRQKGVDSLVRIATMSAADLDALAADVNAKNRPVREEWQVQARELIEGKSPRAAIDRARVEKELGKKFS